MLLSRRTAGLRRLSPISSSLIRSCSSAAVNFELNEGIGAPFLIVPRSYAGYGTRRRAWRTSKPA